MGIAKEIGYFNTFIIKPAHASRKFHIEESRIKGGFNNQSMELATRAFATDENYAERRRKNALIYSGIYNSKTGVNKLNEFSIGKSNTKAVDSGQGSIQKLHAEDTNLLILQEDKISRALIDKDAVFTAEGSSIKSLSNIVIGQVIPFSGRYGIGTNPESFAIKGGLKYFADKKRGVVIRLSRDGHTEVSYYGMRSWFKDNLKTANKIVGIYDNVKDQYVLSLQNDSEYYTLGYDESSKGWTSFYTYKPNAGFTLKNVLYTFNGPNIYKHYQTTNYNNFYNVSNTSKVNVILNNTPSAVKVFKNLSYEGTTGWKVNNIKTDLDDANFTDSAFDISAYSNALDYDLPGLQAFNKKENKYLSYLQNSSAIDENEIIFGEAMSGIKGMYVSSVFETNTTETSKKELFAVSSETVLSSN
tara:strand:+ start:9228 stop:10472 length:1245 start_codon:yes stop_codon:yes gene_type:complete